MITLVRQTAIMFVICVHVGISSFKKKSSLSADINNLLLTDLINSHTNSRFFFSSTLIQNSRLSTLINSHTNYRLSTLINSHRNHRLSTLINSHTNSRLCILINSHTNSRLSTLITSHIDFRLSTFISSYKISHMPTLINCRRIYRFLTLIQTLTFQFSSTLIQTRSSLSTLLQTIDSQLSYKLSLLNIRSNSSSFSTPISSHTNSRLSINITLIQNLASRLSWST